jgi:hypothetical protein
MLSGLFGWKPRLGDKYPKDNLPSGTYHSKDGRTAYLFDGKSVRRAVPKPSGKSAVRLAKKARRLAREQAALQAVSL